jgi:hypothetical protein
MPALCRVGLLPRAIVPNIDRRVERSAARSGRDGSANSWFATVFDGGDTGSRDSVA